MCNYYNLKLILIFHGLLQVVLTLDFQFFCILGMEKSKERRQSLFVYHSRKGTLLHKIPLK